MPDRIPKQKATDMINALPSDLLEATRLTSAGRLTEATAALQRMLGGQWTPSMPPAGSPPPVIDGEVMRTSDVNPASQTGPVSRAGVGRLPLAVPEHAGQQFMPDALRGFLDQISRDGFQLPGGEQAPAHTRPAPAPIPEGAEFLAATFSNQAGSRPYKLYVPSGYRAGEPVPLVVMLHGCTQSPDDFAAGTRMNEAAEERTFIVAYPGQTSSANPQKCWNWFNEGDQQRGQGEPSLIAGITREVMRDYAIDPGGSMLRGCPPAAQPPLSWRTPIPICSPQWVCIQAWLAEQHAICLRRSPPCSGAAAEPGTCIREPQDYEQPRPSSSTATATRRSAPATARLSSRRWERRRSAPWTENGQTPRGYDYAREIHEDANGQAVIERWTVHGAGHAWFGGSPAGSYTDPRGPDATREMIRFFLEHPHPAPTNGGTASVMNSPSVTGSSA